VVSIADIRGLPSFMRGSMKERFRKELSRPVMMDFSGEVVQLLPTDSENLTLTVFDRAGKVIFAASGAPTEAELRDLTGLLRGTLVVDNR
jgi:predicted transcriptional regulator